MVNRGRCDATNEFVENCCNQCLVGINGPRLMGPDSILECWIFSGALLAARYVAMGLGPRHLYCGTDRLCTVLCVLLGRRGLWIQFRERVTERNALKQRVCPLRNSAIPVSAVLCATPLSFYSLLGVMIVANNGTMPDGAISWIAELTVSLSSCALIICGLFALATRFWPTSWLPKNHDDGHLTKLDLH